MGTNYYWHTSECSHCGRGDEPKHIGKSSAGWVFALHVYPEEGIEDMDGWERVWKGEGRIRDEYGTPLTISEMRIVITGRYRSERWDGAPPFMYESWQQFHEKNHSEPGPSGLLRTRLTADRRCTKHGAGTWDCFTGDFS